MVHSATLHAPYAKSHGLNPIAVYQDNVTMQAIAQLSEVDVIRYSGKLLNKDLTAAFPDLS
jgi:hypothetical protein